ncbi:MAG: hypothetical protein FWE54_06685, partial [Methanimicrococcus sp.]|nr:hypothetical protein [Methanimicrococcus sp.]
VNGGNDNGPANETGLIAGTYTLNGTTHPTHAQDDGYDVLFMGWSLTQAGIIDKDGTVPALVTEVTIDDKDVTVYAVWGYDKNGDGTPDVNEKQYNLFYHVNGGNDNGPKNETGLIAGTYTLNTTTHPMHAPDGGYNVLFMGWSLTQVAVIDKDGTVPALAAKVTIADKDVTVYAVWGYDKNDDGIPDVMEGKHSLFYHVNGGNDDGPKNETGLFAGTYTLNNTTFPTHDRDGGYNVLFMGWSLTQAGIIDKAGAVPVLAAKVTIDDNDVTVYAVWGFDKDNNGIPDVLDKDPKASGSGTGGALVVTPGAGPSLSGPSQNPNQTQNQGQNQTSNLPPSDSSQSPLKDYLPLTVLLLFMIAVGIFLFMWKRRNDEDEEKQKQE